MFDLERFKEVGNEFDDEKGIIHMVIITCCDFYMSKMIIVMV